MEITFGRFLGEELSSEDFAGGLVLHAQSCEVRTAAFEPVKSVLRTIFTCAKNEGAFDGANPVDSVLIPWNAREPGQTHAYDLGQVLQILDLLPLLAKSPCRDCGLRGATPRRALRTRVGRLHRHRIKDQPLDVEIGGQPSEDTRQPRIRTPGRSFGPYNGLSSRVPVPAVRKSTI